MSSEFGLSFDADALGDRRTTEIRGKLGGVEQLHEPRPEKAGLFRLTINAKACEAKK